MFVSLLRSLLSLDPLPSLAGTIPRIDFNVQPPAAGRSSAALFE
jgi:hypothetical protein